MRNNPKHKPKLCGTEIPTGLAGIKEGHRVPGPESDAGNDCFVARLIPGDKGKVTSSGFPRAMIGKACLNCQNPGCNGVELLLEGIEEMPLPDKIKEGAGKYAGFVSGASQKNNYQKLSGIVFLRISP